jgi:hypothetical protein
LIQTDGARFELARRFNPSTRFPGVRLKPLGHPSKGQTPDIGFGRQLI